MHSLSLAASSSHAIAKKVSEFCSCVAEGRVRFEKSSILLSHLLPCFGETGFAASTSIVLAASAAMSAHPVTTGAHSRLHFV